MLRIHYAPVLLGGGVRLFEHLDATTSFEIVRAVASPFAAHLTLRLKS